MLLPALSTGVSGRDPAIFYCYEKSYDLLKVLATYEWYWIHHWSFFRPAASYLCSGFSASLSLIGVIRFRACENLRICLLICE
jgi:hypothetical protein